MLFKIATVSESKLGKAFANDLAGRVFFPKNADMELVAGHYAYAVKTLQTKTYDADGVTLVELAQPREILQITATFATKAEAIEAAAEVGTLAMEVAAEVSKVAKDLKLSDSQVAALAQAW